MASAEQVFGVLERTLSTTGVRTDPRAKPITFEMLDERAAVWTFDPKASGPLFACVPHFSPALTLSLRPETLGKLLSGKQTSLEPNEPLVVRGDLDALDCLIDNLRRAAGAR